MTMPTKSRIYILAALAAALMLTGCGGGESGGTATYSNISTTTSMNLNWDPPRVYTDQTPLDPATELKEYVIYVNETGVFTESDDSAAVLSAVNPASGSIVTSFNLRNLASSLHPNVTYFVSMQSVSMTGARSGFSPA
ncbi:MAG: hypothetical protein H6Q84_2031, partial [Deltaproteobacteria bacterium]|nr:hypothetical protein [Deltaproteobacteria bacterium]